MVINIISLFLAYTGMEFIAWAMHKYIMHGFLWSLHQSHHQKEKGFFEKNDYYFLFFAALGSSCMVYGSLAAHSWLFYAGVGITLYGFTYLLVHDIIIHQRIRWLSRLDHPYINALRKAHKAHHANTGKEDGVSFGMLWVSAKYYSRRERGTTVSVSENNTH